MKTRKKRGAEERRIGRIRNGIVGFVAILVAVVGGYGIIYSGGGTGSGEFVEGQHYRLIDDPPRRRPGNPIVVTEFFSYGCIHCRNFEPLVTDWKGSLPDDVRFERSPVSFNAAWAMLAKAYFALEQAGGLDANHERIFRAIHDNGRRFSTPDEIADFVGGRGVERQAFLDAYHSAEVRRRAAREDARHRRLEIATTPTVVVADRYAVNMDSGRRTALEIVDYLIDLERGN